jgi:hypothetical protein
MESLLALANLAQYSRSCVLLTMRALLLCKHDRA